MKRKADLSIGTSILGASALVLALAVAYWKHWNLALIADVAQTHIAALFRTIHIIASRDGALTIQGVDIETMSLIVIVVCAFGLLVTRRSRLPGKRFWIAAIPLTALAVLALLSKFWSISPSASASLSLQFILLTAAALIFAATLSENAILWALEIFAVVVLVLSLLAVIHFPTAALTVVGETVGWRGIFNHKNFLGPVMAFSNLIFMVRLLDPAGQNWGLRLYRLCFFAASLYALWRSNAVASMLTLIAVYITFALAVLYLKWGHYLKRSHWLVLAGLGALSAALLWMERGPILQIFNRSSSLTGRLPLWSVLTGYIGARPLLGYGYGEAFWRFYKDIIAARVAWRAPYAHNGFIELVLGIGLIGGIILLIFLVQTFLLDLRYFRRAGKPAASWPILLFVLIVLVNMSESLLGSSDFFLWMVLVITFGFTLRESLVSDPASSSSDHAPSLPPGAPAEEQSL